MASKFPTGQLVWTCGVNAEVDGNPDFAKFVTGSLKRHMAGDWGNLCAEDRAENNQGLVRGGRLFSVYEHNSLPKIWIITEWDRSVTTILFPDEY